jgi:hypothetical protein
MSPAVAPQANWRYRDQNLGVRTISRQVASARGGVLTFCDFRSLAAGRTYPGFGFIRNWAEIPATARNTIPRVRNAPEIP